MKRIAVIGGGPSGLFSAFMVEEKCSEELAVTVFEASDRLGGKVMTRRFDAAPVRFEAGTAELYRYGDDPLWLFVTRFLGLPVVSMGGNSVVFEGRVLQDESDIRRHHGAATVAALRRFHQRARAGRPYHEFYNSGWPADNKHPWTRLRLRDLLADVADEAARRLLQVIIHSDLATEPHLTNALYGVDNYLINDPEYCQLYAVQGGLERLIEALVGRLSAAVRLGARVVGVEKTGGDVYRVAFERGGRSEVEEYDAVVVALPGYALRQIAWGAGPLREAMARHVAHYDHAAHYLRITALFREPFWRGAFDGSYFLHDAFGGCCVYDEGTKHDAGDHGVLSWLLAGSDALALAGAGDEALVARALDSLPAAVTGGRAVRELLVESHVSRWIGVVSGEPGGNPLDGITSRHCPEPRGHRGLLVVGDYLFDTTINGAFDSAEIASRLALDHLKVAPRVMGIDYFDRYRGKFSYKEAFGVDFDANHVIGALRAVFGSAPPYRLLDAGSASGLTLAALGELGVDAWGIENCWYIHAQTPPELLGRNVFGDVCEMPFPDDHFDFVHESCLAQVPPARVDAAIRELHRVTRRGLMLGSLAREAAPPPVKQPALFPEVASGLTPEQWSERLREGGFRPAITDPAVGAAAWELERSTYGERGRAASQGGVARCFFEKVRA